MRLAFMGLLAALAAGCSQGPSGPDLSPDQFPKTVATLEAKCEEVFDAFDSGNPKGADGALHDVGKLFSSIKRLAEPAGLSDQQLTDLDDATATLLEAFGEVHEPMHEEEFPKDFDFEPIRGRVKEGLAKLRAALPQEMVAQLDEAAAKRAATRPAAATPAPEAQRPMAEASSAAPADAAAEGETAPIPGPGETPSPGFPGDAEGAAPGGLPAEAPAEAPPVADPAPAAAPPDQGAARRAATPAQLASASASRRSPLCPSVMLFDAASISRAPERVARVAELVRGAPPGDRWVQLVATLHARLRPDLSVEAYGRMVDRGKSWSDPDNFAVARGLNVSVLPHLDAAGGVVDEWRNRYRFGPNARVGAGSYRSLLIDPLADAIEAEASSTTRVDLALSGEMGRSLFDHPEEYLELARTLRERFAANPRTRGVRVGVALNWTGLAGGAEGIDRDAVARLFAELDFVGFSCYAPVGVPPRAEDFAAATRAFLAELADLGGGVRGGAALVLSESGIGGGYPLGAAGEVEFPSPEEVAERPFDGRGNGVLDPWRDPALAALRSGYHQALCDYLGNRDGVAPPIEKAFLWSEGPWDPQGVADRRFRDEAIAAAIDRHNNL